MCFAGIEVPWEISPAKKVYLGLAQGTDRTPKRHFLDDMIRVITFEEQVLLFWMHDAPGGREGRMPFVADAILRIHSMRMRFALIDIAIAEAFFDTPRWRDCAGLYDLNFRLSGGSTGTRLPQLLAMQKPEPEIVLVAIDVLRRKVLTLRSRLLVDARLIPAQCVTKNASVEIDSDLHQSEKGSQWYLGATARVTAEADSYLGDRLRGGVGNVNDVVEGHALLQSNETVVNACADYQDADRQRDMKVDVCLTVSKGSGKPGPRGGQFRVPRMAQNLLCAVTVACQNPEKPAVGHEHNSRNDSSKK